MYRFGKKARHSVSSRSGRAAVVCRRILLPDNSFHADKYCAKRCHILTQAAEQKPETLGVSLRQWTGREGDKVSTSQGGIRSGPALSCCRGP